jgi:DNA topoisomerase-3
VETTVQTHVFRTRGKVLLVPGWRGVYGELPEGEGADDDEGRDQQLPRLERGEGVDTRDAEALEKETKPPRRYSDASLLAAMETAGKLVDDEELREAMKDSGIGTPATRASIIERLVDVGYIERDGRSLVATEKGIQVIRLLGDHKLTSPELTGDWEKQLSDIEHGNGDRGKFIKGIADFTKATVEQIAALDKEKLRPERVELGLCPRCGAETGEIIRENAKAYGCTSWKSREEPGCGFVIWKRVAGRTLTPEIARQLIEEGRTREVLSGFRSRAGKPFRARLVLNGEGKIEFEFPTRTSQAVQPTAAE